MFFFHSVINYFHYEAHSSTTEKQKFDSLLRESAKNIIQTTMSKCDYDVKEEEEVKLKFF